MVERILKFSTTYCGPCKALAQILKDFKDVPVEEINADENEEMCTKYNIRNVPTLIFLDKDNKEIGRNIGLITVEKLRDKIKEINEI